MPSVSRAGAEFSSRVPSVLTPLGELIESALIPDRDACRPRRELCQIALYLCAHAHASNYPRHAVLRAVVDLVSILGSTHTQDLVLYFNAFAFCLFGLPHIFSEDGNLTAMGFSWTTDFMPRSRSMAARPATARSSRCPSFLPSGPGMRATEMPKRGCGGSGAFEDWCLQRVAHPTAFGHAGRRTCQRSSSSW